MQFIRLQFVVQIVQSLFSLSKKLAFLVRIFIILLQNDVNSEHSFVRYSLYFNNQQSKHCSVKITVKVNELMG